MGRRKSGKYFTLDDATEQGHIVRVRCSTCGRAANFIPEDLAEVYGGSRPALIPLFPCSRCQSTEFVRVTTYDPDIADFGRLTIRRPGPMKTIRTWHNEILSERSRHWYEKPEDFGF